MIDHNRGGAELFGAGCGLEAQETAADGDRIDLAAQLARQFRDLLVDGTDVLQRAVDVGEFGSRDRQAGGVGAGGDDELVIRVHGSGRRGHGPARGVDAGHALAGLQRQRGVVPHRGTAQGEVDVAVGEGFAQGNTVVGKVGFLGEDGDVPAVEAPGVHGIGKTVGGRAASGNHDAARCVGARCALVLGA